MNDNPHPALLPAGLYDLLPEEAQVEADVTARLMGVLAAHGYERVKPPLVEFEETLLTGAGTVMASDTFRMLDPSSHRMIGVRADMTPQVARIATTRLGHKPRPLRLSYAGQVLRTRSSQMRPERQMGQAGAELIGTGGPVADVEAIAVAAEALLAVGVPHLSVDVTLPTLVPAVAEVCAVTGDRAAELRAALDRKDAAAVAAIAGPAGDLLAQLIAAAGPADATRAALERLELPATARRECDRLGAVLDGLKAAMPQLKVTVDPVENRGFEYHTGISFTFFARMDPEHGPLGELGRGGRYEVGDPTAPEPATGFTLYTDTILRTLPEATLRRRVLVPLGTPREQAATLRGGGWITVAALSSAADWRDEARRLDCGYVLIGNTAQPVGGEGKLA
ncbi:MAG: ATP phosphoribosyltransferase regulatory subunit [Alphaproteobacteria bacterium]|nr:ATP phosphoribosyltransferase regulatory subunit [Alphaproteobacteria bacterium]